jgi:hypothetical protein
MPIRCPGQNQQFWTPDDISFVQCAHCGTEIEFWKDEPTRPCPGCGRESRNPGLNLACAAWCRSAAECLGQPANDRRLLAPQIERLKVIIERHFDGELADPFLSQVEEIVDRLIGQSGVDPAVVKPAALLAVATAVEKQSPLRTEKPGICEKEAWGRSLKECGMDEARIAAIQELLASFQNETRFSSIELKILREVTGLALVFRTKQGKNAQ